MLVRREEIDGASSSDGLRRLSHLFIYFCYMVCTIQCLYLLMYLFMYFLHAKILNENELCKLLPVFYLLAVYLLFLIFLVL
jgi:hypothetical protein